MVMATSTAAAHPGFRLHSCKARGFMDTNTLKCLLPEDQDASGHSTQPGHCEYLV